MRIELRGVEKRFGRVRALAGVDLVLPAGSRVALVGPNGSGKSTLTRVVMGLLSCTGEVLLDGRSPWRERERIARRIAYVPQIAPSLSAPVDELLRFAASVRGIDERAIVEMAGRLNLDVQAIRSRAFRDLSGGMRQKLQLALALCAEASLLVLDEPTASLDVEGRSRLFERIGELSPGVTLLLSSHRLEELRHLADHVVVLQEGRVVESGPVEALLAGQRLATIQVAAEESARLWLEGRGFRSAGRGFWLKTVTPAEKLELLSALGGLGTGLRDVTIRESESLDAAVRRGHG